MSNPQAPFGFRPVRRLDGAQPNYKQTTRYIAYNYGTKIAFGDPVATLSSGYIGAGVPGAQILGIFRGCKYYDPSQNKTVWLNNWPAPTTLSAPSGFNPQYGDSGANVEAYIFDDPNMVFEVQAGNSTTTAITIANVGYNADFLNQSQGNSAGISTALLRQDTIATTSTFPFRIVGVSQKIGNDNSSPYNTVDVIMNNQDYKTLTGV